MDNATETKTVAGRQRKRKPLPKEARGTIAKYMAYLEREGTARTYATLASYTDFWS